MDPDPDPGHFIKIYWTKNNFQIFCLFFSLIFILKLDEPFRNEEIFLIFLFFKSSDLGFRSKKVLIFYPFDPDPWIRIFLRIRNRIQEAKIWRTQPQHWPRGRKFKSKPHLPIRKSGDPVAIFFCVNKFYPFKNLCWNVSGSE